MEVGEGSLSCLQEAEMVAVLRDPEATSLGQRSWPASGRCSTVLGQCAVLSV